MRTTLDLPDDLHRITSAIARDSGASLSETVGALLRASLGTPGPVTISTSARTGLRVAHLGRVVTSEDVRALEDDA